ncbi:sugar ABC transporter permease [Carbonactinospora thermoautotrophica]|nr:carbohydrate ABC transporter permease [Carbonactinospora thermoautotrophica]MCX9190181.1 sugar ABC transporter permease [Carbonactinospora thermoautotrophica]
MSDAATAVEPGGRREKPAAQALGAPRRGFASRVVNRVGGGLVQVFLALVAVFWLIPTFGLLIASLRTEAANSESGWWTVFTEPAQLTLGNYADLLANPSIIEAFFNTFLITVPSTVIIVIVAALAAYAFAWIEFPGRDWLFLAVVALLVVPIQVGLIPVAKLFGALGIFGTIPGVVLFHVAYGLPFAIFLLRNYFAEIPRDLLEAARMDGGTEWTIFHKVVMPLGLPAIASLTIFQFLWVWNDMLVALVFSGRGSQPLTVALQQEVRQFGANFDVLAPGAFLSLVVPLIVFFAFQRYFVQGVMAGSVK